MAKLQILPGWLFPIPGLFIQAFGLFSGDLQLSLVGSGLLSAGLAVYVRGKGYHPAWGLWGVVPALGPLLLVAQPDRHRSPGARMRGGVAFFYLMALLGIGVTLIAPDIVRGTIPAYLFDQAGPAPTPPPVVAQQVQVQPEPAPAPAPEPPAPEPPPPSPAPTTFEEGYRQIKPGMTYEEVCKFVGDDTLVVGVSESMRIVRWRGEDRQAFTARFIDGKLDLLSSLQKQMPPLSLAVREELRARFQERLSRRPAPPEPEPEAPPTAEEQPEPESEETPADADQAGTAEQIEPPTEEQPEAPKTGVVTGRAKPERVVRVGSQSADKKPRPSLKRARLPKSSGQISRGANDVIFVNRSENTLRVGVRLRMRGADFDIAPGGYHTLFLSNGSYSIYYIDTGEPETLHSGGQVQVDSPPTAIQVNLPR
ncbi:MAG TPA: hypothetical protein VMZ06_14935 [Candidatus Bathyarchaeia archaeon]|nr:hypothetical protein [Candidatus Bathyarchaeia archaeon]